MVYTKKAWVDGTPAAPGTAILAADLDRIEQANVDGDLTNLDSAASVAKRAIAAKPPALAGVQITPGMTTPFPIEYRGGVVWGVRDSGIFKSTDDGATWVQSATSPGGQIIAILWCNDGEVLLTNGGTLWKSTGWATNPATATYTVKLTKSAPAGVGFRRWGFDGDGQKFILTEYSGVDRAESRYVWISVDAGATWNIVIDKSTVDPTNLSHMHAACYDPWEDRFWFTHGHGDIRGSYYSDDDGLTWTKMGGDFQPDAAPVVMVATDDGIVCGSDSGNGGLYGIPRVPTSEQLEMRQTARWSVAFDGVAGFAERGYRDPNTGLVYFSFKSDSGTVAIALAAGSARAGAFIWRHPTPAGWRFPSVVVTDTGKLLAYIDKTTSMDLLAGQTLDPGAVGFDAGNTSSGLSLSSTSVAAGPGSAANNRFETVYGSSAITTGVEAGTAIGAGTKASSRAVALGNGANAAAADSVSIGNTALADGVGIVVIGSAAVGFTSATGAVAIGQGAKAGPAGTAVGQSSQGGTSGATPRGTALGGGAVAVTDGTAVGHASTAGSSQVAVGKSATANAGANGVALGNNTTTTAANQVAIGARHVLMLNTTPPAGSGLFVEGGALKFKGSSGTVTTIALA